MIKDVLRNLNLFVDGRGYAGRVAEVELPKLTIKTSEYRAGGMDMPVEIDMGMEKLEATITLNSYDPDVLAAFGLAPGKHVPLTVRGALTDEDGTEKAVVVNFRGQIKEIDKGTWKPGEDATLKFSVALRYYKLEHDGRLIYEIDPENMIRVIDGVDQLAARRAALGL